MNSAEQPWQRPLTFLALGALLAGIIARFSGLGGAPFAVDEYYLSQSISNLLRHGVPQFDCGGYYTRGLLIQYIAAALQWLGTTPELATRAICAVCSVLALPAAYLLGCRIQGRLVGTLAVIILALSVWEIEIARFGRMYAPFQAVFLWYLVYFLQYVVDRRSAAWKGMLVLSMIGPFVWEGGIFLLLANLLPVFLHDPQQPFSRQNWTWLAGFGVLLLLGYLFIAFDFRGVSSASFPSGFNSSLTIPLTDPLTTLQSPLSKLPHHPLWLAIAFIPLAAAAAALLWLFSIRSRPLLALGLSAALLCALLHQLLLLAAVLLLLVLMRYIAWNELFGVFARRFWIAVLLLALFWLAFGIATTNWHDQQLGSPIRALAMLGYQFLRFPDFIGVVVRPWAWAVPHLGAALFLLCALAICRMARSTEAMTSERALLIVLLIMVLAASASHPPRQETRYVFHLYPLALLIALAAIYRLTRSMPLTPVSAAGFSIALALGGFALTEDFMPQHLLHINSPQETFRINMSPGMQSHLVIRDDYRALSDWLQRNVPTGSTVINGVHGLDRYYSGFSYYYVDETSPTFPECSCRHGTVERWGNYPLLYTTASLSTAIGTNTTAYLVTFGYDTQAVLQSLAPLSPRIAASEGAIIVIELRG